MSLFYPMPAYHFRVEWGGANVGFMEVSGLNINIDVTEFRNGADPSQTLRKMPGLIHTVILF
jgi:phage tail-like protein